MKLVCSRELEEARDFVQNVGVAHSFGIVIAWGIDECDDAAIGCGCGPEMDTNLSRLGLNSMSYSNSFVTGDELDELFVK